MQVINSWSWNCCWFGCCYCCGCGTLPYHGLVLARKAPSLIALNSFKEPALPYWLFVLLVKRLRYSKQSPDRALTLTPSPFPGSLSLSLSVRWSWQAKAGSCWFQFVTSDRLRLIEQCFTITYTRSDRLFVVDHSRSRRMLSIIA